MHTHTFSSRAGVVTSLMALGVFPSITTLHWLHAVYEPYLSWRDSSRGRDDTNSGFLAFIHFFCRKAVLQCQTVSCTGPVLTLPQRHGSKARLFRADIFGLMQNAKTSIIVALLHRCVWKKGWRCAHILIFFGWHDQWQMRQSEAVPTTYSRRTCSLGSSICSGWMPSSAWVHATLASCVGVWGRGIVIVNHREMMTVCSRHSIPTVARVSKLLFCWIKQNLKNVWYALFSAASVPEPPA